MNSENKSTSNKSWLSRCFGEFSWSSPKWCKILTAKPKAALSFGLGLVLIIVAFISVVYWYKHLPKPNYTLVKITPPKISTINNELVPDVLTIDFGTQDKEWTLKSVAPLADIGKEVSSNITISPEIKGKWLWESDSRLVFTPKADWPAGQKFDLSFSKNLFSKGVLLENYKPSFSTKPFKVSVSEFSLYQDPFNPEQRQAVATLNFSFPVDDLSLEEAITLKYFHNAKPLKFNLKFDNYHRKAYLRSENIELQETPRFLKLTIAKGVEAKTKTSKTENPIETKLEIPDLSSYFKIKDVNTTIIRSETDRPEQILTVETSLGISEKAEKPAIHAYLLPIDYPATESSTLQKSYAWANPGEVTESILALAKPIDLQAIATQKQRSNLRGYKFSATGSQYLYVKIDAGLETSGFKLNADYAKIIKLPELPKEVSFLHKGALLAFSGEKKISVLIRGLPAVKFQISRILPDNINLLVTQTEGNFASPRFINQSLNQQNIAEIFSEVQLFDASDLSKQHYTSIDLAKYLGKEQQKGLFLLEAYSWDKVNSVPLDKLTSRLVLITDFGLLVKDNHDGSHQVFVQSITNSAPVSNITVDVLGKNGLPILTKITDEQGQVSIPSLKDYVEDKEPVAYLAHQGSDLSFIPFASNGRQLNFSRFDVGGVYSNSQENSLAAYLFSDRGLYRPGDTAHIAMIVKQAYALPLTAGLPVEAIVTDPRGTNIQDQQFSLDATGLLNFDIPSHPSSPTGQYLINLYTVKDKHTENFLGSTTIRIAEFQPDRMRISSELSAKAPGWISPEGLTAEIHLWNLYGAPANDRKISAKILLTPHPIKFDLYPDYLFVDPFVDPDKPVKTFSDTLKDVTTNAKGEVTIPLNLERFDKATYQLSFFAEGFEAEGGRSVTTQSTALVSANPYFVGYKTDGELSYIKQAEARALNFIAVDPTLKAIDLKDLSIQVLSANPITTLVKKDNGSYEYQSIMQTKVLTTEDFSIAKEGTNFKLPTQTIGEFIVKILNKDKLELSRLKYTVVGASQAPVSKDAELKVSLSKAEYKPGEEIELHIRSPYAGGGLITIERDKVRAVKWFKADTSDTMQTIKIPEDLKGDAYVSVAFIRSWDSPEIFISPLSYAVLPFSLNHKDQELAIDLELGQKVQPGEALEIKYKTDVASKIIIFAADEGILQAAGYKAPDPLAFFFQKHALEVITQQTLDQILPKYIEARELSAAGGDEGAMLMAGHLNPFKRKTDLPVAFWSGILDADSTTHSLSFPIPDYFNGSLQVMAVAVADKNLGSAEKKLDIHGNFVINPNVPTFVTPGDEFEVTASIASMIEGPSSKTTVELQTTKGLELIGEAKQSLDLEKGLEKVVRFKLKAKELLGSEELSFKLIANDKTSQRKASLSIRPASAYQSSITSGVLDSSITLPIKTNLYPEFRTLVLSLSKSPLIFMRGLKNYLDNFPYGCTEQLVSKAMPLLVMQNLDEFKLDKQKIQEKFKQTLQMLGQRQMTNGGFSYWPNGSDKASNDFASIYAMQFLTEARDLGFDVPRELIYSGIAFLKDFALQSTASFEQARLQAYAIYLLTRSEVVTTNYLTNLQNYLDNSKFKWKEDITGVFIAATYKLLKSSSEADKLIKLFNPDLSIKDSNFFYDKNIARAQYLYILARDFPELAKDLSSKFMPGLIAAINSENINTILSSYTSLALAALADHSYDSLASAVEVKEIDKDKSSHNLSILDSKVSPSFSAKELNIQTKAKLYYLLTDSGYSKLKPKEQLSQGIEVFREYRSIKDKTTIDSTALGQEIEVHIQIRALSKDFLANIAIVDLLPGGFEVVSDSLSKLAVDYTDAREDRVIFFTSLTADTKELIYRIKATNTGTYTVPPIFAESMYDPVLRAQGLSSVIKVTME